MTRRSCWCRTGPVQNQSCQAMFRSRASQWQAKKRKKNQIGDHALPQRGFGLSTPSGEEGKGATPSNTRHRRQRESRQRATHKPRSEHTQARRQSVTEAPTKGTKAAITEHTASRREREQLCKKEKGSRIQGMQCATTESASKEST
jgi:hypothetical protein